MKKVFLIVGIILVPLIPIILVVTGVIKTKPPTVARASLVMWTTEDDVGALQALVKNYTLSGYSYVHITTRQIAPEDYANRLIKAWAAGSGPDIFFVPHDWVGQMRSYAVPSPADLSISKIEVSKGLLGNRTMVTQPKRPGPTVASIRQYFVDAVATDAIQENQIWGLPLSMDTVALYYNKDLLNNAKIFEPAKTWEELVQHVQGGLTILDDRGNIVQSGVALGTYKNVPYAGDLLTTLMIQNGATMTTADRHVKFKEAAGLTALDFYTSFALPTKRTYSWNNDQPSARDAFLQGKVAYYFGTYADRVAIAKSNLSWSVTSLPHLSSDGDWGRNFVDLPRYSIGMVAKSSKKQTVAWNFLQYISEPARAKAYLNVTQRLGARKSLLNEQVKRAELEIYANQLLTARSWYQGTDAQNKDKYLETLVNNVVLEHMAPEEALDLAAKQIESTL